MDYTNYTMDYKKQKHLNLQEMAVIELRLNDGYSAYKRNKSAMDFQLVQFDFTMSQLDHIVKLIS